MVTKLLKFLLLVFPVFLPSQAFWWHSSSTEAPPSTPPLMKQIPLTYFRTYTYQQPLTSNAIQLPLLSSTDYITNYNALSNTPLFNPMMPVMPMGLSTSNDIPMETKPKKSYGNFNMVRSLGPLSVSTANTPLPTSTTTTTTSTTTTTTPEPTTTTSTEAPTTLQMDSSSSGFSLSRTESLDNADATYPAFNRKAFTNHFNINYNRPVYPYPEYSIYKSNFPSNNDKNQAAPNVEYVHCMCPINMPNAGGFPSNYQAVLPFAGNPTNSILLAQGRTTMEAETSLDASKMPSNVELTTAAEASNSLDDLHIVKLNKGEDVALSSQSILT